MSRFDYIKYDDKSEKLQAQFKKLFVEIESMLAKFLPDGKKAKEYPASVLGSFYENRNLAIKNLEQAYMFIGKAIRDEQILRTSKVELQEERKDDSEKKSDDSDDDGRRELMGN